jgi:predicted PurR-regulated permease PerM
MKQLIDIDTKTFVRFWLVVIGFGLAALAIYNALGALIILGTALFLALALNIPVSKISRRLPGKSRVAATAISYVAVLVFLGAIIFLVIPPIVQQTAKFAQNIPSYVDTASSQWHGLKGFIDQYNLQPQVDQAVQSLKSSTSSWAGNVGQTVISGVGSLFTFLASLLLVLVLAFLMLIEGPAWMKRIWGLYENRGRMEIHKRIVSRIYGVVAGYVSGQLTVSTLAATFSGLAVFVISLVFGNVPINLALPAAAITFLLSLIPMFGSTIGGILIALLLSFNSVPAGITYFIYFVVYQQIENNFLSPHIQSRKIDLSALAILASITIGLYIFGLAGGIIAIPIAGSLRVLLDEYLIYAKKKREASAGKSAKSIDA